MYVQVVLVNENMRGINEEREKDLEFLLHTSGMF